MSSRDDGEVGADGAVARDAAVLDVTARAAARLAIRSAAAPLSGPSDTCLVDTTMADFQAGVFTSCDVTTSPGDVTLLVGPQIDQRNILLTTTGGPLTATSWGGQTFTPAISGQLTRIDLTLFCSVCTGTTPDLTVSVRATTGNPAVPTGLDLAAVTSAGFNIGSTTVNFTANFPASLTVTAGTRYAVIVRPVSNPSAGTYAYLYSTNPSTNPYANGQRVTSANSGATWVADITSGGRDLGFTTYVVNGFVSPGTFTSPAKDSSPALGDNVHWTTLSWSATTPASTTLQFQVAASNDPEGPFSFVGPDGTGTTFFASGDSLARFDGNRFLEYQALLATGDRSQTPTLQDATTCFHNTPSTVTTSLVVSPATAAFGATVDLTAVLSATGTGLAGRTVSFTLNAIAVGDATTDAQGTATVTGVSLAGIEPGSYPGAVAASYAGETGYTASAGTSDLTVSQAAQTIAFTALPDKVMTDGAFAVSAAGGASENPVTFSTASSACSVTGTTVTLVAAGTCAIQADQAGTTEYAAAAPVTRSFTISRASQTITFPAIASFSWSAGSATLAATASSGLTVAYSVTSGPCSLAGVTLTATAAGTCVVTADQAGNASYGPAAQATASATVTQVGQTLSFAALPDKLMTDGAVTVGATGGASGNPVTFSTSSAACSVTGTAVTLVAAGTCAIQADQAGNANYAAATPVTRSFTITRTSQTISFPAIASFSWSGGSASLGATASSELTVAYSVQSGPCSIAGTTLTATAAGTCVVAADQAGNASYGPAAQVTASATVSQVGQTIGFGPLADRLMTAGAFSVGATGGGSGNPVTFSTASAACSVTGAAVTLVAAGTCAIQADQAGNANYAAATPVTRSFTISRTTQTITFPAIASFSWSGGSAALAATASSELTVAYSVTSGPCSIAGTTLTATAAGTCVVAADQAGNASYSPAAQVTASATVTQAGQTLSFAPLPDKVMTDGAFTVGATGGGSGNPVTFSTTSAACSVTGTTVTLVAAGTCAIQADQAGNANYTAAAPVTQSFTVSRASQTITFPALASFSWSGGSATLAATASSDLTIAYSVISGPCSLAGVTLTATAAGTCVVAADQAGNATYGPAAQVTASATVTQVGQTLSFAALPDKLMTDGAFTVSATGGASGNPVTFSTASAACSVTGAAVTLVAAGTCAIQADQAGNTNYAAATPVTRSFLITRTSQTITFPALPSFSWSGGSATLAATASSELAVSYSVISGPCSVAGGVLTAAAAGTCVVAADQAGNASYGPAAQVTASATVTEAGQTIGFAALPDKRMTDAAFLVSATGGGSGNPVTFSTASAACSVTGATVTLVAAGACAIRADQAGNANYTAAAPVTQTFTISLTSQTIAFPEIASFSWSGGAVALAAAASSELTISYSVVSGPCSIAGTTLTATAPGTCVVVANQPGDARYSAAPEVTASVTVTKASQTIDFGLLAGKLMTDSAFSVGATGGASGNPVTFSTSSSACSVTGTAVTLVSAGTCTILADQEGNAAYDAAATVARSFTISLATQAITFPDIAGFSWNGGSATLTATASSSLAISYAVQSGPCSVTGATLTASAPGVCVVAANQAGNTSYSAAPEVSAAVTVAKSSQTISFPAIASFSWSGGSASLAATASSGLAVSYSVQSGPCSLAGATLTATGAGSCVVAADQAGNGNYLAALRATTGATVTNAAQTITFPEVASFVWSGGSATLAATASSELAVVYSVTSGPCNLDGTTLTATAAGSCVVAADQAGDGNYAAAARVTITATALRASQSIALEAIPDREATDPAFAVTATGGGSTSPVLFSTTSTACSISGATVTLIAAGSCTVQASQAEDANYDAAPPVTRSFAIAFAAQSIAFPEITTFSWHGGSATLGATATSALAVSYSVTSGPCTVSGRTLTATTAGSCMIAAHQAGDARYLAAPQITAFVTVARAGQTIVFPDIEVFAAHGGRARLEARASSGLAVSYQVQSGPCTITDGTLTATAPGTCVVTADQIGDDRYLPAVEVVVSVTAVDNDNGCGCRSTNHGAGSSVLILIVAVGLCRRRRAAR